jgi:hypothetical protein
MRFEVRDVIQHQVDVSELGRALNGCRIVRNPATDVFFSDEKTRLLVITRTLTSACFAVHAFDKAGQSVKLQLEGLADILGGAKTNVSWTAEGSNTVAFHGKRSATFAFAAVPCAIAYDGTFVFGLESSDATMGQAAAPQPEMSPVIDQPGLLTFDSPDEAAVMA